MPIIAQGPLDTLFEGMPVMLVADFESVDETSLHEFDLKWYSSKRTDKAWAGYWYHEIQHRKHAVLAM